MADQRHAFRLSRSLVVVLPPLVQHHLGVKRGAAVYWHAKRKGEVVLTLHEKREGGHPEGLSLQRRLTAALAEVERLRQRNEARDRTMYAEGHSVGYQQATEALTKPHGPSATRQRRRKLSRLLDTPAVERARSRLGLPPRGVSVAGSVDAIPLPDPPLSSEVAGGDAASGGAAPPGRPQEQRSGTDRDSAGHAGPVGASLILQ